MSSFVKYASVLLDVSINKTLDYGITPCLVDKAKKGSRVEVPVRGHLRKGFIYSLKDKADYPRVKAIAKILSSEVLISDELFDLASWMSKYYCTPLRQVLKSILPSTIRGNTQHKQQIYVSRKNTREQLRKECEKLRSKHHSQAQVLDVMLKIKKDISLSELLEKAQVSKSPVSTLEKKGLLLLKTIRINRSPLINEEYFRTRPKTLNKEQSAALSKISSSLCKNTFETHLLYGITGSGKTEVYLQAIDKALEMNKGTIMLVPEISLTPQTIERFRSRFDKQIAILHCRLSLGERYDEWHRILKGEASIVIGARSAIFSPVSNLGLIIIDEEHESSYKQTEESPCYHARDVAVMRAFLNKSTVILGSATPSLESFYNAMKKKYTLSKLNHRANTAKLADVIVLDMQEEYKRTKSYTTFSDRLLKGIERRMAQGEQSLLFLNRRGYHSMQLCLSCNNTVKCPHCDLSLTFHYKSNILSCHLCNHTLSPPPTRCPSCESDNHLKYRGIGTEQIQRTLHAIFPKIRTIRLDADTTRHKGSHEKLLRNFRTGKADVMIGTQMVAKGLHFPQVTLVGVLNSDASLNIPDFRSSERIFQLLTQVSGRAGRGEIPGEVIIQTRMPENRTIELASKQDFLGFYKEEILSRKIFEFPPYVHLIKFTFTGLNEDATQRLAKTFYHCLILKIPKQVKLSPVSPSGYAKIKERYRFQFLAKAISVYQMNQSIEEVRENLSFPKDIRLSIDVDPSSTFF